jgi:tetratricopeptide (TPR) repeat protein
MKMRCLVSAVLLPAFAAIGLASDSVKTTGNKEIRGEITQITPAKVVIEHGGASDEIPSIEIQAVNFDGEPGTMKTVQNMLEKGDIDKAAEDFDLVQFKTTPRKEIQQEYDYYRAYLAAKLAVAGEGKIDEAGHKMLAWVNDNPGSFHYYNACEILGDLLLAMRRYDQACIYYNKLTESPFPELKMRAGVATGRAMLLAKKVAEAQKAFATVLTVNASGDAADSQRLIATLGKARCAIETGDAGSVVKTVEEIIDKTDDKDPANAEAMATAYNTLGAAYKKAGKTKEALMAYLRVDVIERYAKCPDAHAEALANLVDLWTELRQPDRANKARRALSENYKNSPWAAE